MYREHYGFKRAPFSNTSEPHFFFESDSHREAYAAVMYGIKERKGIILVSGECGTGKTTLCKMVLDRMDATIKASLILNPYFSDVQLLQAIVEDFGLHTEKKNRLEIIKVLNDFLIEQHRQGGNAVIIIDESQHLTFRQLEQVRLLSNLETSDQKLLQIVLVGQPELIEKLNQFKMRQIRQRISVKHTISPLKEAEIGQYMDLRLRTAGKADLNIQEGCYRLIHEFSGGIPRLINMVCDRALLIGYVRDRSRLDEELVRDSIKEIL